MTVLETIQRSSGFLSGKGVESPRLQAEWLLAHVLGIPRLQLYLQFERVLTEEQVVKARELVQRRGKREPLQHILGTVVFCGHELRVGLGALIPRPETELLAEASVERLRGMGEAGRSFLDFGTGSGCLAVSLALGCPEARGWALDRSVAALALARENAASHGLDERLVFLEGDGFAGVPEGLRFGVVVSNPPYIPSAEVQTLEPEVRDYDPREALDGGVDGLDFYRRLAVEAPAFMLPGGWFLAELGDGQAEAVRGLFEAQSWIVESVTADYSGRLRVFQARLPEV
ncbi:MAG: peptide chain release factor N(5)-glutamine methyltransferase [Limisphaerales bacterium]